MKRIILKSIVLLTSSLLLTSCMTLQPLPLKGTYLDKPYEVVSDKKFEQVWTNIIDLFATKGLSIKLIDKSSGLIISEKTSFINDYSFEDKTGKLENPNASVVIEKITYSGYNQSAKPEKITGEWNIRIKENSDGKTIVNVNLTNIEFVGGKFTSIDLSANVNLVNLYCYNSASWPGWYRSKHCIFIQQGWD